MIIIQAKLTNPIRSGAPPVVVPFPVKHYEGLYRRLDHYKQNAGAVFASELDILAADMRSGS